MVQADGLARCVQSSFGSLQRQLTPAFFAFRLLAIHPSMARSLRYATSDSPLR